MAELSELKSRFIQDLVAFGVTDPPQQKLKTWAKEFRKPLEPLGQGRHANRFLLGAECEVVPFIEGRVVDLPAERFGFIQKARPYKMRIVAERQRFCIGIVASIWRALQVLRTQGISDLMATEYYHDSGLSMGGSIHFSRRGQNKLKEIEALDALYLTLVAAKVFDPSLNARRQQGDHRWIRTGLLSDARTGNEGYEYRSFPTFVKSPFQALLVLTLAKLAVLQSEEVSQWPKVNSSPQAKLLNLLARFKGLDDDARLAYWLVAKNGLPTRFGKLWDEWKLSTPPKKQIPLIDLPLTASASPEWIQFAIAVLLGRDAEIPVAGPWWRTAEGFTISQMTAAPLLLKSLWRLRSKSLVNISFGLNSEPVVLQGFEPKDFKTPFHVGCIPSRTYAIDINRNWFNRPDSPKLLREFLVKELGFFEPGTNPVENKIKPKVNKSSRVLY